MSSTNHSSFDDFFSQESFITESIDNEFFGEEEENIQEILTAISEKMAADTANMSFAEAAEYYNENMGETWLKTAWDVAKKGAGWVADKVLGGGGGSSGGGSTATATSTPITSTTVNPNITNTSPVTVTNDFSGLAAILSPTVNQTAAQKSSSSSNSNSRSGSSSRSNNQFNPTLSNQFNPYLNFNPYLQMQQAQLQQQVQQQMQQQFQPQILPPPYPGSVPIAPLPQQQPCPPGTAQLMQQLNTVFSNPQAMAMLTNMLTSAIKPGSTMPGVKENYDESFDDSAEFLPIIAAIASAVAPALIKAAPTVIKGVGSFLSKGGGKQIVRTVMPMASNAMRHVQRFMPQPPRFTHRVPPIQSPIASPPIQQPQGIPTAAQPATGGGSLLSGILPGLLSLIQSPSITGALGNLVNTGLSSLTSLGQENVEVSETAILNAISEYARMAAEELESLGIEDNLEYMKDETGQWKYDPNIATYRAEALMETLA